MKNRDNFKFTYESKRVCLFCNEPIPDQAHAARKFCKRFMLDDGTIINHHDDYHSLNRKEKNAVYRRISEHHKLMHEKIKKLLSVKGENIVLEDINQCGIKLGRPVEFVYKNDFRTSYFIDFAIEQTGNNHYKIIRHGRLL